MRTRSMSSQSEPITLAGTTRRERWSYDSSCKIKSSSDTSNHFTQTMVCSKSSKVISDVVTPNFKVRSLRGEIFNNPCTIQTIESTATPVTFSGNFGSIGSCGMTERYIDSGQLNYYYYGDPHALSTYLGKVTDADFEIDIPRLKSLAITDAYSKIDSSDAAILATMGELDETVKSLVSIFKKAVFIFRATKRADIKALKGLITPKQLANDYMEFRYALRPLVYDASMILKAVTHNYDGFKPMRQTFRSRRTETKDATDSDYSVTPSGVGILKFITGVHREVQVSAGVLTAIEFIDPLNVWGFDQTFETIWELTPFSFVIDWFFNVGKTIASWTPETGVKNLASWVTVRDTYTCTSTVGAFTDNGTKDFAFYNFSGNSTLVSSSYTRTPNPNRSFLPRFNLKLDGFKLLDLAIIGKQLISN